MSLISNRGRFTKDNEKVNINGEEKSSISSIGVNPSKMFDISNHPNNEHTENIDVKEKLSKINSLDLDDDFVVSKHKEYNDRLNRLNTKITNNEKKLKESLNKVNWRPGIKTFIAMFVVEVLTIVLIVMFGSIVRYSNLTQEIPFDIKNVDNTKNISESTLAIMKGFKTVAVFGVDSRTGSVDKGNNADVNIIANLNLESGEIQLVSVYRDLYLSVTDDNLYTKLNTAYRKGGPEQAVKTINKNFDLNIDSYFAFNWKAVADGIELLGGIDIEITKSEFKYLNAFIHETCIATGIDAKNPAAHYIKSYGFQHLDGIQAVAYGRLRLMDSDFQRVERQKKIVGLCLEKAKNIDINTLKLIVEAVLPQIGYAFDMNEIFSLIKLVKVVHITYSTSCPEVSGVRTVQMGSNGDCVVPLNLQKSVTELHKILYNVDNYNPSSSVKNYSARIIELRRKYEEENKLKESSVDGSEEGEEENGESESTTGNATNTTNKTKKRVATSSSAKSTKKVVETAPNDLPIVDADSDKDLSIEPEEDNSVSVSNPNNDVKVYDAPGVPSTTANNNAIQAAPGSSAPISPSSTPMNGVVVSGPPGGDLPPYNNGNNNDIVPIIGAPY